jgi:predicted DNA-binding protein
VSGMSGLGSKTHGVTKQPISLRLSPELVERLRVATAQHPYKITATQIIERGIELALADLQSADNP